MRNVTKMIEEYIDEVIEFFTCPMEYIQWLFEQKDEDD